MLCMKCTNHASPQILSTKYEQDFQKRRSYNTNENEKTNPKEDEEGKEDGEGEDEGEVEDYEDLEVIVQGAYHKNETVNAQHANAKPPSNSLKEDSHFLSHHNINNGFSEAIEILRKSGSLNQGPHKGSNGCCRDNIQMISQV